MSKVKGPSEADQVSCIPFWRMIIHAKTWSFSVHMWCDVLSTQGWSSRSYGLRLEMQAGSLCASSAESGKQGGVRMYANMPAQKSAVSKRLGEKLKH